MKPLLTLAALALLSSTAHAELILEPLAYPGGLNSGWTAMVPGTSFLATGRLGPEAINSTGTITISSAADKVTYSGISWTVPAATDRFNLDVLQFELSVPQIQVTLSRDITLPMLTNFGNTLTTPGFAPTEFATVAELEIAWSITGPTEQVSGVSRWPFNTTAPVYLGQEFDVRRHGSVLLGQLKTAETGLAVIWGEGAQEVFNGTVDGIPVTLRATTIHSNQFYFGVPEPATWGLLGVGVLAIAAGSRRKAWR